MQKISFITLVSFCLILIASCGSGPKKSATKNEEKDQAGELLEIGQIGSAQEKDRQKRLKFLTSALMEKRGELQRMQQVKKENGENKKAALQQEILTNEVLLLEAEKYGLEEGLILPIENSALESSPSEGEDLDENISIDL